FLEREPGNMSRDDQQTAPRYRITHIDQVEPVPCPCGMTRRAFGDDADGIASLHVVDVTTEARTHYHKQLTELYYVLEGHGSIELDGQIFDVRPGTSILIKAGCRHRAIGQLKILNVPVPAFDPDDEWFD
ncbi:MAG: cupin domain-containing protein, partial [Planctomycetales bacterium]